MRTCMYVYTYYSYFLGDGAHRPVVQASRRRPRRQREEDRRGAHRLPGDLGELLITHYDDLGELLITNDYDLGELLITNCYDLGTSRARRLWDLSGDT